MPLSLRIPPEKDEMIRKAAAKKGNSKSSYILEAIEEKLGIVRDREKIVRELAGWMSHEEAEELRKSIAIFDQVNEEDWK
jgi:uncharacterized protein (DUF1778 family)